MIDIIRGKKLPQKAAVEESFCRLYDYWHSVTPSNRLLPGRQHINPADITDLLGRIALVDVHSVGGEKQFQYRLWGSIMTEIIGKDCTGKFIHDLFKDKQLEIVQQAFEAVVEAKSPHFSEVTWGIEDRDYRRYKRLLLPLAADGKNVNMILGSIVEVDLVIEPSSLSRYVL
ncbi:PAS domain-containing protein [Kiloniella majae]|uniref:PAS domain-containing protein n=1 Tax=Kiloniella majae TaxID=1938558 RepID=UPI000A276FF9|nr:PAS domain-containing protein [Kiloniella majae]